MSHLTWTKITSFPFRSWCFFLAKLKVKWSIRMTLGAIITSPNHNKWHKKWKKKRNTVTSQSESSIRLLSVQSHIPPHLQRSVLGSPTFQQEQRLELPLFALHRQFMSSLHASDTLSCVIWHGTKLFPCLFHSSPSGLRRVCIGTNDWTQTNPS